MGQTIYLLGATLCMGLNHINESVYFERAKSNKLFYCTVFTDHFFSFFQCKNECFAGE